MSTNISLHRSPAMLLALAAGVTALGLVGSATHAAMLASDNAGNYQGSGGTANVWTNVNNNPTTATEPSAGTGFGAWAVVDQQAGSAPYNGSGLATFDGTKDPINTNGNSWYMYANNGKNGASPTVARADIYRAFTGNLSTGQEFSIALQTGSVGSYPAAGLPAFGFSLDNGVAAISSSTSSVPVTVGNGSQTSANTYTDGSALFSVSFNELGDSATSTNLTSYNGQTNSAGGYILETNISTDGTTVSSTSGLTAAELSAGITANFALATGNAYTLTLDSVGTTPAVLATYTGTLKSGDVLNGVDVFDQNTNANGTFNSLAIVPEPATMSLFLAAGAGLLLIRRRRTA
ncbi:MAG: PEP-CTERM sorting domain-containing protein [Phycisphaerae bacterium]